MKAVERLLQARRVRRVRADDLRRLHVPARKVLPFVVADGHRPVKGAMALAATGTGPGREATQAALF